MKTFLQHLIFITSFGLALICSAYTNQNPFLTAMLNMMETMGMVDHGQQPAIDLFRYPWPLNPQSAFGYANGLQPNSALFDSLTTQSNPWFNSQSSQILLDGVWQGRGSEILIIRGNQFRVYKYVDGSLQIQGNKLIMHHPQADVVRQYEFATQNDQLILRDPHGQILLYSRLPATPPSIPSSQQ